MLLNLLLGFGLALVVALAAWRARALTPGGAAAALGLGTQWVSVNLGWERKVRSILKVPEDLVIHTLIPIGYPVHKPAAPYRRELKEIVHYEEYDQSRYRTTDDIVMFLDRLRKHTKPAYNKYTAD